MDTEARKVCVCVYVERSEPDSDCRPQTAARHLVCERKMLIAEERSLLGFHRVWSVKWVLRGCRQEAPLSV